MARWQLALAFLLTVGVTVFCTCRGLRMVHADTSRYNAKLDVLFETLPGGWPYSASFSTSNKTFRMDSRSGQTWQLWPNGWRVVEEKDKQFTPQNTEFPGRYTLHEGSADNGSMMYRFDHIMGNTWSLSANGWIYVEDAENK